MSIPFRLVGGAQPLILLEGYVNDFGPFNFILDTGAGFCLVTPKVASDAAVTALSERTGTGAAGTVTLQMGITQSIALGGVKVRGLQVGMTDELMRIGNAVGERIDGAIGYDFLRGFRVTLDYAGQTMSLAAPSRETNAPAQCPSTLTFRLAHPAKPLILIDAFVDDDGPFIFAFDTGASITTISRDLAAKLQLATVPIPSMTGGGGAVDAALTCLRSLRVATRTVSEIDVAVSGALEVIASAIGQRLDGILGYNFLMHHRVVLDYPNETLTFLA